MNAAMGAFALRLAPGADLRGSLEKLAREQGWAAACVTTCVGSVSSASIRLADAPAPQPFEGPFEIVSLVGTLSPDGAHLHIALADGTGRTIGGHLGRGTIVHTTAELVLGVLDGVTFAREDDPVTGYRELVVRGNIAQSGG